MKRGLKEAMEEKFKDLEYNEKFTIATFLDPRFKHKFFRYELIIQRKTAHRFILITNIFFLFRNKETLANVRATIHVKLIEQEEMEILDTPVVVEEDKNSKISNSFEDLISNIATKATKHGMNKKSIFLIHKIRLLRNHNLSFQEHLLITKIQLTLFWMNIVMLL